MSSSGHIAAGWWSMFWCGRKKTPGNFEIGRFLHLKSRNPKSQIGLRGVADQAESNLRFRISGFEILESPNFKNVLQPGYDDQAYKTLKETHVE
jgi:hypothetical protein